MLISDFILLAHRFQNLLVLDCCDKSDLTINFPAGWGVQLGKRWDQYVFAWRIYRIVLKSTYFQWFLWKWLRLQIQFPYRKCLQFDSFFHNISKQDNTIDWKMSKTRKQFKKIQNSDWINSTNHEMKQVQHLKTIISKIWLTKFHTAWMIVYSQWDWCECRLPTPMWF